MVPPPPRAEKAAFSKQWSNYWNKLNPVPTLPDYSGPYEVGTVDVEIPASDLHAPSAPPSNADNILTVQFRIYFPAQPDSYSQKITWLPSPQRSHVLAYAKMLGFGPVVAQLISFLPRHLNYITIPVHKNAPLADPEHSPNRRWPTMIFSHGLGGNRNTYSHIAGSLASYGVVVICPEHRDGSSVVSFIRDPSAQGQDGLVARNTGHIIPYAKIPHDQTRETWKARNQQLKIRLWELGLVYEAVLDMDSGLDLTNLNTSTPATGLTQFASRLHVREAGSVIFGGHSFGAATVAQLLKSTYYAGTHELEAIEEPLFVPGQDSRIRAQINAKSLTILLDMWCFPLLSPTTTALYRLPLPVFAKNDPSAPGGSALLAIESEGFVKWTEHLYATCRILSPAPEALVVSESMFQRQGSQVRFPEPYFFYVVNSGHVNQSDFGVLFPWLMKKAFGSDEPTRALRLNVRAMLQFLRINEMRVASTWIGDMVDGTARDAKPDTSEAGNGSEANEETVEGGIQDDRSILDRSSRGPIECWKWIDTVGMVAGSGHEGRYGEPEGANPGAYGPG